MLRESKNQFFEAELQKHLWKCELQYRAKNKPEGSCVGWLEPMCDSTQQISDFLQVLGFEIFEVVDELTYDGRPCQWVETTDGIIVFTNGEFVRGFVTRSSRVQK